MKLPLCISCEPEDLDQGLFGHVLPNIFQILPYLHQRGIYPAWEIRTKHYGDPPQFITIPGALDLAYEAPTGPYRRMSLNELRRRHSHILGNDWPALARIWKAYFKVPKRVLDASERVLPEGRLLGIHYRGTDKQTTSWDSNPITQQEYLVLINDFLQQNAGFDHILVGTDEHSFVDALRSSVSIPVVDLGPVEFHMAAEHTMSRAEKTDRAMLDCLLFSRCKTVLSTSSALPSFAKLFNPSLEIFRCAASKRFSNMPYFPVAYTPILPVTSAASMEILSRTMHSDWTSDPTMARFRKQFSASPRWPSNQRVFRIAERFGAEDLVARVVTGYR